MTRRFVTGYTPAGSGRSGSSKRSSGEPEDIIIAYGQGKSVVNYMVERWGEDKISELFEVVRDDQ